MASVNVRRGTALVFLLGFACSVGSAACSSSDDGLAPPLDQSGPGSTAASLDNVHCAQDTDCHQGEACTNGLCQMRRCADISRYKSVAPLGQTSYMLLQRSLLVTDGNTGVSGYTVQGSSVNHAKSWTADSKILDIAGGNLTSERPEQLAYAAFGSTKLWIVSPKSGAKVGIDPGFSPELVATGDIDADGYDEIAVARASGPSAFAVCKAGDNAKCTMQTLSYTPDDIAVGDVDGDGYAEVLILQDSGHVVVHNVNFKDTAEDEFITVTTGHPLSHIAAGDLDGDGVAEIVGKEDSGFWPWEKSHLHVYNYDTKQLPERASADVGHDAGDISVVHVKEGGRIAVVDNGSVQVLSYGKGSVNSEYTSDLGMSGASRIGAADIEGVSAMAHLKTGPTLAPGPTIPIAFIALPPYSRSHSQGPSTATVGSSQDDSTSASKGGSYTNTVSLTANIGIGIPGLPIQAEATVTGHLAWTASHTKELTNSVSIGQNFTITANPDLDGDQSGGVVTACACFHQYEYVVDDTANALQGADKKIVTVFLPVGGDTMLWSSRRYNALATELKGSLPQMNVPYKLGQIDTYPNAPQTLAGKAIPQDDNVFPKTPSFRASDVANVSFSLSSTSTEANTTAKSFQFGATVGGGLGFGPFINVQVTDDKTWSLDESYTVSTGTTSTFSGGIEPVRDDPSTPENEYTLYGYSFQPLVYREHYDDTNKKARAFYVMTYAVGK
jgi:hypothetical protein